MPSLSRKMLPRAFRRAVLPLGFGLIAACGNSGQSTPSACWLCGSLNDVKGSITTKTGSQSAMQSWVVGSFEHDTGIARLGEVDQAGIYTLSHMRTDHDQTLALFTPDYILQAVLSIPGTVDKTVKQWVKFQNPQIPALINNGPIVTFANLTGLTVDDWTATAATTAGTPDGVAKFTATSLTSTSLTNLVETSQLADLPVEQLGGGLALDAASSPVDRNGFANNVSADIDGDGLINWLDPDDNGNTTLDIFDADQNSDLVNDLTPAGQNTDQWFNEGIKYFAVEFELIPKDDGSGNETHLSFSTKLLPDATPIGVQIRGAPNLLNGALVVSKQSSGTGTSSQAWDKSLVDDGTGNAVYTQSVTLASAATPQAFSTVFLELVFGSKDAPWYIDYPWTFPSVTPASISAQYDANTHNVQLVGNPFGTVQSFVWTINVFDSTGATIWNSQAIPGSKRQFAVQANVIAASGTYKYSVVAQSLDKVPGHPAYAIHSPKYDLK